MKKPASPETFSHGAMAMVKIDGTKVRELREKQGLTQLYVATAVQVTTDTISRWENKRYPSIKKENGLKLAEALGVELEELLETTEPVVEQQTGPDREISPNIEQSFPPSKHNNIRKAWPLLILSATIGSLILAVAFYFLQTTPTAKLNAIRILPRHCIAGQPFPVIIKVNGADQSSIAIILKESLPPDSHIIKVFPEPSGNSTKGNILKWLLKIQSRALFSYLVAIDGKPGEKREFNGTLSINNGPANTLTIRGDHEVLLGEHHWADSNSDNIISDNEILTVYDLYSDIKGLKLDMDMIEEIWLGSGYRWNRQTNMFEISE
ncbi:transcriptional regulator [Desulfomarina profundi]|uniref:Transcriptional regulator n=1 Tax=Desulfomarina profundi TaxID=2772557 RepID=A0A8D5JP73_9BACT|nr:helix-turn-helix transcriptional regulator [Desulfomarina profundi]BCL60965.1 transcriptional regulator [Desulfomarina profundi]